MTAATIRTLGLFHIPPPIGAKRRAFNSVSCEELKLSSDYKVVTLKFKRNSTTIFYEIIVTSKRPNGSDSSQRKKIYTYILDYGDFSEEENSKEIRQRCFGGQETRKSMDHSRRGPPDVFSCVENSIYGLRILC